MGYSMLYTCQPDESTLFGKKGKALSGRRVERSVVFVVVACARLRKTTGLVPGNA